MTDFARLREEYAQYKTDIAAQDFAEYEEKEHENQSHLHSMIKNMEKNLPRKNSLEDSLLMFEAYQYLHSEYRQDEDFSNWLAHTKKIVNDSPEKQSDNILGTIITTLPDITSSSADLFNISCKALKKISSQDLSLPRYHKDVEKYADRLFADLMLAGRMATTDEEKSKHFEKAFKMTIFLSPLKRVSAHRETIGALAPIYNKSEYGRVEINHKQSTGFSRVWKSLPMDVKNMYKQKSCNYK